MKKLSIFFISIIILSIAFSGCGPSEAEINATATARIATSDALKQGIKQTEAAEQANANVPTFKVIKSTGLYSEFNIDAKLITSLSVGTILMPADNKKNLVCDKLIEAGETYTLCKVKVIGTGQTGWVLQKWIEKN